MDTKIELIEKLLSEALGSIGAAVALKELGQNIEVPADRKLGDLAFPCFALAKSLRKAPPLIAKELVEALQPKIAKQSELSKVVATGAYINFFLNTSFLAKEIIPQIISGEYIAPRKARGKRVMVEYSQPNTHKAFHVGHIRCAALGDSIARIFSWNGYEVVAANYIGDEGSHVAKCLWYLSEVYKGEIPDVNRGEFLGQLYTAANDMLDLSLLTKVPFLGVLTAKVLSVEVVPDKKELTVVKLDTGELEVQVITGATGFSVGDIVPWAKPGTKVIGRNVGKLNKHGIESVGMICSFDEIGLSLDKNKVPVLPADTKLGIEMAEIYKFPERAPSGHSVVEELQIRQKQVSSVLQRIEAGEPEMKKLWEKTKDWSMSEFYEIYDWLNCRFDLFFFESEFGEAGKNIVSQFLAKGVLVESDGAVGADLSKWGLGFCLLVKRDGTALYATRDLALAQRKFDEYKIDHSVYVVDSAQSLHFQQVFKTLEIMQYPQAKNCYHLAFGQVSRPDGKMSSRKGNVILFSELRSKLHDKIYSEYLSKYRGEWSEAEIADAGHKISLATMRYGMLNQDNNSLIIFDLDEWTARSGNTGPYLMYAYARVASILRELDKPQKIESDYALLTHETEIDLILKLKDYPHLIEKVAENYSPHLLCAYLYELAKKFSSFYAACSVKNAESEKLLVARLDVVSAVGKVLKAGLGLIGIETIERM